MNNHGWGNNPEPGDNRDNKDDKRKPGGNQGPPDLEEVWRDVTQRLRGLFGGKPGPGGGGFGGGNRPNLNSRHFGGGVGIILVLIAVVWLSSGFYQVDEGERGVVLRFGRYSESTGSGLHWHLPYPFESNEVVPVQNVRRLEIGYRGSEKEQVLHEALMLTDDENIVNIQFAVQYSLKDEKAYLFNNRDPDEAVKQSAETSIREVVGSSKMDYVLTSGREEIARKTRAQMQEILDRYDTGIEISSVTMQKAQPPAQVRDSFADAVKASQDSQRFKNDGEAYAKKVIPLAKGDASKLLEEAEGYKQAMIATAEGDASRFKQILTEYSKAPEATRSRLYIETMEKVYSNTSKVMVDAKGQGNLLYLPLDKLIAASSAAAAAAPAAVMDAPPARVGSPGVPYDNTVPPQVEKAPQVETGSFGSGSGDARRRENLRNRDRGGER